MTPPPAPQLKVQGGGGSACAAVTALRFEVPPSRVWVAATKLPVAETREANFPVAGGVGDGFAEKARDPAVEFVRHAEDADHGFGFGSAAEAGLQGAADRGCVDRVQDVDEGAGIFAAVAPDFVAGSSRRSRPDGAVLEAVDHVFARRRVASYPVPAGRAVDPDPRGSNTHCR